MKFLTWLETTGLADWVAASLYGYPIMLTIHALGLATIVGVVFALDLRLLGYYRTIPCASLSRFLGIAWIGIALNVFSGLSIFITQASYYVTSVPFLLKITFIVFGCINLAYTQKVLNRESANWDAAGTVPTRGLWLGGSSLAFWLLAVVTGRLIAYL